MFPKLTQLLIGWTRTQCKLKGQSAPTTLWNMAFLNLILGSHFEIS